MTPNKQLERTVIRRRVRAASAPLHYALAARWTAQRAAAQRGRSTISPPASLRIPVLTRGMSEWRGGIFHGT